ncbi:hypothetical protein [Chondrinema litorale]|uniref:hypothetical protein n=1 Tax=Chondrinema litorale TaxID=2994555 RepID=UPI0025432546|nr:hypothetical protein [Chondrinema litorale]UZR95934.1 hypothetical protein OQ292_08925 [Chondrinema litorale]
MEFDRVLAESIIKKYNLSYTTFNLWKVLGEIPDKYKDEAKDKNKQTISDDTLRIIAFFDNKKLRESGFIECFNCSTRLQEAKDHQLSFSKNEIQAVKKSIGELKENLQAFLKNNLEWNAQFVKNLQPLFFDSRIERKEVFNQLNHMEIHVLAKSIPLARLPKNNMYERIKICLVAFYLELDLREGY